MTINKEKLFELYMQWVYEVSEECDWKTSFGPEEINDIEYLQQNLIKALKIPLHLHGLKEDDIVGVKSLEITKQK